MSDRLNVQKTYKLYIGGAFPRSESGRVFAVRSADGTLLANASQGSRKDLRDAVSAARAAQSGWANRTAYNRAQILYRVAEVMEGRSGQFVDELVSVGVAKKAAHAEVSAAIDRWVWYAGWCDKIAQAYGTVNPVAGPYFNFSVPEATGVVGVVAPESPSLLGLVAHLAPVLVGGNAALVIASESQPLGAITLSEVLATSDLPGGVVNILTGNKTELLPWLMGHMDVNAVDLSGAPADLDPEVRAAASSNVKRVVDYRIDDYFANSAQSPTMITGTMELKTVWHPIGV
jgi:acyl-CoA reductase-like NAD-dependent aldehyde dehydrogenase